MKTGMTACKVVLLLALVAAACGDDGGGADTRSEVNGSDGECLAPADWLGDRQGPDGGGEAGPGVESQPEAVDTTCDYSACPEGTRWQAGTPIFKEVTEEWGLKGVLGSRLSVTDLDMDGWPDLLVRNGGGPEDFAVDGGRTRWVLRNTGEGSFEDVTQQSGLFTARAAEDPEGKLPGDLLASGDVDNDGDLDVYVAVGVHNVKTATEFSELMLNNGDGTFSLGPKDSELRMEGKFSVPCGTTFVDVNRDGFLDNWTGHNMVGGTSQPLQDRLFLGDGTGHFQDVTIESGLETLPWLLPPDDLNAGLGHSWAWSTAACDLNNDGVTELLVGSYGRAPNHLWQGQWLGPGQVTFKNVSVASGYAYDDRMDWSDNESARCFCKLHPLAEDCEGVPPPQYVKCTVDADIFRWNHDMDREPWRLGGNSACTTCQDVDNDGNIDLMTGEIVHWDVGSSSDPAELMFNTGETDVRFVRPGNEETGLVRVLPGPIYDNGDMTNDVFDFDNDGWADVYIGSSDYPYTKGLLFHQESPRKFQRVETTDFFEHLRSHGVVTADFDHDGDLDIVVGHSLMRCGGEYLKDCYDTPLVRMFENVLGSADSNWLQIRLEGGEGSNRAAIGARVKVTACAMSQVKEVDGGHGHVGTQKDFTLHFGLGPACNVKMEVRWPDEALTTQTFLVPARSRYLLKQGGEPVPAP
jgi:hypothetical protein